MDGVLTLHEVLHYTHVKKRTGMDNMQIVRNVRYMQMLIIEIVRNVFLLLLDTCNNRNLSTLH